MAAASLHREILVIYTRSHARPAQNADGGNDLLIACELLYLDLGPGTQGYRSCTNQNVISIVKKISSTTGSVSVSVEQGHILKV